MATFDGTEADVCYIHTNGDCLQQIETERADDNVDENKENNIENGNTMPNQVNGSVSKYSVQKPNSDTHLGLNWSHVTDKKYSKLGPSHPSQGRNGLVNDTSDKNMVGIIRVVSLNQQGGDINGEEVKATDFVGRRDVSNPETVKERSIVSRKGSVRGFKNRVRAGIATFLENQSGNKKRDFTQQEKGKIVIYTTSMTVVRETFERCAIAKKILQTHMVRYEEKDLFMSSENQKELMERLGADSVVLPQVFVDGASVGGVENLERMNEEGKLRNLFENFTKINVRSSCERCGGYRFVPCISCHGSKKSIRRNYFTEEFSSLRCMQCDENGLQRCDQCLDQQE